MENEEATPTPEAAHEQEASSGFQPITSQEALDAAIQEAIGSRFGDYDQLKADLKTARGRIQTMERERLISRIAQENNIPQELADRLTGDTEEALRADARNLAKYFREPNAAPKISREPSETQNGNMAALRELLSGLSINT